MVPGLIYPDILLKPLRKVKMEKSGQMQQEKMNVYTPELQALIDRCEELRNHPDLEQDASLQDLYMTAWLSIENSFLVFSTGDAATFKIETAYYSFICEKDRQMRKIFLAASCDDSPGGKKVDAYFEITDGNQMELSPIYSDGAALTVGEICLPTARFDELLSAIRDSTYQVELGIETEFFIPRGDQFLTEIKTFQFTETHWEVDSVPASGSILSLN